MDTTIDKTSKTSDKTMDDIPTQHGEGSALLKDRATKRAHIFTFVPQFCAHLHTRCTPKNSEAVHLTTRMIGIYIYIYLYLNLRSSLRAPGMLSELSSQPGLEHTAIYRTAAAGWSKWLLEPTRRERDLERWGGGGIKKIIKTKKKALKKKPPPPKK